MVSTGRIPGFIGPPEFRGRTSTVSDGDAGATSAEIEPPEPEELEAA